MVISVIHTPIFALAANTGGRVGGSVFQNRKTEEQKAKTDVHTVVAPKSTSISFNHVHHTYPQPVFFACADPFVIIPVWTAIILFIMTIQSDDKR